MTTPGLPPHRYSIGGARRSAAIALMCLALASCSTPPATDASSAGAPAPNTAPDTDIRLSPDAIRSAGIVVAPVRTERRNGYFETPAVLQLDETRTARIGAIVEGVVVNAEIQVGARVGPQTRLADLHSHMVHEAWAEYRRAVAEQRRASLELDYMRQAEGRATRLLAVKAISQQEAERAHTDRGAAEQALVIADSEIRRALDELEHLGITPDSAATSGTTDTVPVTSPIGGVVLERLVTAGTAVTTGTPLFVVSDLRRLWALAEIDEARLPALAVGRSAELTVDAYPGRLIPARIVAIGDSLNPNTRRVTARVAVENVDGTLKPQMFATVRVPTDADVEVVIVPAGAVQKIGQKPVVFVETAGGVFEPRPVVTGAQREGLMEIHSGLAPATRIATTGTFLLKSTILEGSRPE